MQAALSRKVNLTALYLTYFCDLLSWSIVLMIFAPLLVPVSSPLLAHDVLADTRNLLLGLLTACAPLTQCLGAPVLGELSDHFGRRLILLVSTLGTALCFALSALAVVIHSLDLLFISRLLSGFLSGNATLSQAAVVDLVTEQARGRYLALFTVLGGLSWIVGPYMGNLLSSPAVNMAFTFATPFWAVGLLFLLCFVLLFIAFKETRQIQAHAPLAIGRAFKDLVSVFAVRAIRLPFSIFMLMFLGWFLFMAFFSAYLIEQFHFSDDIISHYFLYLSVWFMVGGLLSSQWLLKKYTPESCMLLPLLLFAGAMVISSFFTHASGFWWTLPFAGACQAIVVACLYTIHSKLVSADMQGRIFGTLNAAFGLCFTVAPVLAGWLADKWVKLPLVSCSGLLVLSFLLYLYWFRRYYPKQA